MERAQQLPSIRRIQLLGLSRCTVRYRPTPTSGSDFRTIRRINELHLDLPFDGARILRNPLALRGWRIGRMRVTTLIRRMRIEALYCRKSASQPQSDHTALLDGLGQVAID